MIERRLVLLYASAIVGAAMVGALVVVSPVAAVGLSSLLIILVAAKGFVGRFTQLAVLSVLALPTGWGVERLLKTEIGLGAVSSPVQIVLPIAAVVLIAVAVGSSGIGASRTRMLQSGDYFAYGVLAFVASTFVPLVTGVIDGQPFGLIYRDLRPMFMYLFGLTVVYAIRAGLITRRGLLFAAITGLAAFSAFVLAVYMNQDGWRRTIYAGASGWETSSRVGFGTTSLLVIAIPVCIALASSRERIPFPRFLVYGLAVAMIAAIGVSQSRSTIAAAGVAILGTLFVREGSESRQSANRARLLLVVFVVVVVVSGVLVFTPVGATLVDALEHRGLVSADQASTRTRINTFQAALGGVGYGDMLVGKGFGSLLDVISGEGGYFGASLFIDNAALTALLKGGVPYLVGLVLLLTGVWSQARAARRCTFGTEHQMWSAVVAAFPWFIVITTMASAHVLNSPAVAVGIAVLGALAATACASGPGEVSDA